MKVIKCLIIITETVTVPTAVRDSLVISSVDRFTPELVNHLTPEAIHKAQTVEEETVIPVPVTEAELQQEAVREAVQDTFDIENASSRVAAIIQPAEIIAPTQTAHHECFGSAQANRHELYVDSHTRYTLYASFQDPG